MWMRGMRRDLGEGSGKKRRGCGGGGRSAMAKPKTVVVRFDAEEKRSEVSEPSKLKLDGMS